MISIVLLSFSGHSQEYNYFSFNELYDFNTHTIYDIKQDGIGNYWMGTADGLVKFNGKDFTYYAPTKYDQEVTNVQFDDFGRVWCSNFAGQLFYLEKEVLHTAVDHSHGKSFISQYAVVSDSILYYLLWEDTKLFRSSIKTHQRRNVFELDAPGSILQMEKKAPYLSLTFSRRDSTPKRYQDIVQSRFYYKTEELKYRNRTRVPIVSSKQSIISYNGSNYFITATSKEIKVTRLGENPSLVLTVEQNGSATNGFWFKNESLIVLGKKGLIEVPFRDNGIQKQLISGLNISCFFMDTENNLLLGTLDDGIILVPNTTARSAHVSNKKITRSFVTPNHSLYYIDAEGDLYYSPYPYTQSEFVASGFVPGEAIAYNKYEQQIYFSGVDISLETTTNTIKNSPLSYFKDYYPLSEDYRIYALGSYALLENTLGKRVEEGKLRYNFLGYERKRNKPFVYLRKTRSNRIVEDIRKNFLYINYIDGLYCYSQKEAPIPLQFNNAPLLISCIQRDPVSGVWVGTHDGYVLKYNGAEIVFKFKLPAEVKHIAIHENLAFLYTGAKVIRLDTETNQITSLNEIDGLIPEKITALFCRNNKLYVVGGNRIQQLPVSYNFTNNVAPKLFFDEVQLFNKPMAPRKNLLFDYDENHLTFVFHAIATRSQGQFQYEYRLSGTSEKWIPLSADMNKVTFSRLAPGNYTFEVRAVNEDGKHSKIKRVSFTIDKHFSQKWWFILLSFLCVSTIVFLVVRLRYRVAQKQNQLKSEQERLKKEVYKSKIAAIRSQMNPHFMFNALNTIQEFIMTNQKDVASEYLADFADLMRKYLDQSKKEDITLSEEIETLEIYLGLENLRFDGALNYSVYCTPTINPFETTLPVMLIQPFVENAIKHGLLHKKGDKRLYILFERIDENAFRCTIEDNGIGRQASTKIKKGHQHASFATKALDQKMEMVNKGSHRTISCQILDLTENGEPTGTKVIIEIK